MQRGAVSRAAGMFYEFNIAILQIQCLDGRGHRDRDRDRDRAVALFYIDLPYTTSSQGS